YILGRYRVSGIIVSGTIIRGNPDPASDLDIYVIHQEDFRQRIQKFFGHIPAEIFVNPPHKVEAYFVEEGSKRRPITAHMLATGFVILDIDPVIQDLIQKAKRLMAQPPAAPKDLTTHRYFPALLFEDAVDIAQNDPATAQMILSQAVTEMLNFSFIQAGEFIPRQKSLLKELEKIDDVTADLPRNFFEGTSFDLRLDIAGKIADRTIKERDFFEWKVPPEKLP
ncbi:hypothetical protein ACFLXI_09985, partial [Chloroflexota bacterium]